MLSYEFYKVLHIAMILFFLVTLVLSFLSNEPLRRSVKIMTGITTLLILVAGMGLLARIGVSHTEGWPMWAYIKLVIWLILGIGVPIAAKRLKRGRVLTFYVFLGLMVVAAFSAIYKPFEV